MRNANALSIWPPLPVTGSNPGCVKTNDLKINTCRFLTRHSTLLGYARTGWLSQNNVTEWDIRWPDLPAGQHDKAAAPFMRSRYHRVC